MWIPMIRGVIDRRILINFRVQPDVLSKVLPPPFRPQLVAGWGVAGICLVRLREIRPRFLPRCVGIGSENAAHRIAVEWASSGETHAGVYIPRRDTSSLINHCAGGRLFPGVHNLAQFDVHESGDRYRVAVDSSDGGTRVVVDGRASTNIPFDSVFHSVGEASEFFARGALGYSPTNRCGTYDGLELRTLDWSVEPLTVDRVESSFFAASGGFPQGSAEFDCALLMRDVHHEWHAATLLSA